jgi:methyltransferase (TIGR00027 family)
LHWGWHDQGRRGGGALADLISESDWRADKAERADPLKLTALFHRSVPVLQHLNWSVTETGFGSATSLLPLSVEASNQHIAHQAAVILIAADYTGGIALGTCLTGTPLVGIHPQHSDNAAYLWGARAEIKWIKPSIDDLICRAVMPARQIKRVRDRYFAGKRVLEPVTVEMFNGLEKVAEATITYWVQDTVALRKDAIDPERIHVLYDHKTKVSAKLIAGMRAIEQRRGEVERLFHDPTAIAVAGKHGVTVAERFLRFAPQLQRMVAARTHVLDKCVARIDQTKPWQVVNIGSGLDTRFARIQLPKGSCIWNLDLPHMLTLRKQHMEEPRGMKTQHVPFDINTSDLDDVIRCRGFEPADPSLFIWEGGSMYFEQAQTRRLLMQCRSLMSNESLIWLDYVDRRVVDGSHPSPIVQQFVSEMRSFGEPFVSGFDDVGEFLSACKLKVSENVRSSMFSDEDVAIFDSYGFATAVPA